MIHQKLHYYGCKGIRIGILEFDAIDQFPCHLILHISKMILMLRIDFNVENLSSCLIRRLTIPAG